MMDMLAKWKNLLNEFPDLVAPADRKKMMAKEASERYQSWEELLGDIGAQLQGRDSLDYEAGARGRRRAPGRRR